MPIPKHKKMSLIFDEYGRPYVIIRDQETKSRLKGLDAQKVCNYAITMIIIGILYMSITRENISVWFSTFGSTLFTLLSINCTYLIYL